MIVFPKKENILNQDKINFIFNKIKLSLKNRAIHAYIFGSVAKGTYHSFSDLDILLVVENSTTPFYKRALEFEDILDLYTPMDLLGFTKYELDKKLYNNDNIGFWGDFKKYKKQLF